ncbi:MAG: hypothetical protein JNN32_13405 [Flavobacteriales bacterium]|nr:hypothetical protein [Flavobacteriales bacterium]
MTHVKNIVLGVLLLTVAACSSEPKADETPEQKETRAMDEAAACDPLVGEFRDLMVEYEKALGEMVAAKKVDAVRQEELATKAKDLSERIKARGEKAIGVKCWSEFNTIGKTYGPRIMKLGIEVAMMEGGMQGMDPALLEQLQKVMQ